MTAFAFICLVLAFFAGLATMACADNKDRFNTVLFALSFFLLMVGAFYLYKYGEPTMRLHISGSAVTLVAETDDDRLLIERWTQKLEQANGGVRTAVYQDRSIEFEITDDMHKDK